MADELDKMLEKWRSRRVAQPPQQAPEPEPVKPDYAEPSAESEGVNTSLRPFGYLKSLVTPESQPSQPVPRNAPYADDEFQPFVDHVVDSKNDTLTHEVVPGLDRAPIDYKNNTTITKNPNAIDDWVNTAAKISDDGPYIVHAMRSGKKQTQAQPTPTQDYTSGKATINRSLDKAANWLRKDAPKIGEDIVRGAGYGIGESGFVKGVVQPVIDASTGIVGKLREIFGLQHDPNVNQIKDLTDKAASENPSELEKSSRKVGSFATDFGAGAGAVGAVGKLSAAARPYLAANVGPLAATGGEAIATGVGDVLQGVAGEKNIAGVAKELIQPSDTSYVGKALDALATNPEDPAVLNAARMAVESLAVPAFMKGTVDLLTTAVKGLAEGTWTAKGALLNRARRYIDDNADAADDVSAVLPKTDPASAATEAPKTGFMEQPHAVASEITPLSRMPDKNLGFAPAKKVLTEQQAVDEAGSLIYPNTTDWVTEGKAGSSPILENYHRDNVRMMAEMLDIVLEDGSKHLPRGEMLKMMKEAQPYSVDDAIMIGNSLASIPPNKLPEVMFRMQKTLIRAYVGQKNHWEKYFEMSGTADEATLQKYLTEYVIPAEKTWGALHVADARLRSDAGRAVVARRQDWGQGEYLEEQLSIANKASVGLKVSTERLAKTKNKEERAILEAYIRAAQERGDYLGIASKISEGGTFQHIVDVWRAGLLSAPATWTINLASNTGIMLTRALEDTIAAGVGKARRGVLGSNAEALAFKEIGQGIAAAYGSLGDAAKAALAVYRNQKAPMNSGIATDLGANIQQRGSPLLNKMSVNVLTAEDEFFHILNRSYSLRLENSKLVDKLQSATNANSRTIMLDSVGASNTMIKKYKDLDFNDPNVVKAFNEDFFNPLYTPKELDKKALEDAKYWTFNADLNRFGKSINSVVNRHPGLQIPVPFVRTPINVTKHSWDRTPGMGAFSNRNKAGFRAGGIESDRAIARQIVGSLIFGLGYLGGDALLGGEDAIAPWMPGISGTGPADMAKAINSGWQKAALKVGDYFYQFSRFEPLSIILQFGADLAYMVRVESKKAAQEGRESPEGGNLAPMLSDLGVYAAKAASAAYFDRNMMQGVVGIVEALNAASPSFESALGSMYTRTEGSIVPAFISRGVRAFTEGGKFQPEPSFTGTIRDFGKEFDNLWSGDPVDLGKFVPQAIRAGIGAKTPIKHDAFGRPVERPGGAFGTQWETYFHPVFRTKAKPVETELLRLGAYPEAPPKRLAGKELTHEQQIDLKQAFGKIFLPAITKQIEASNWKNMTDGAKLETITHLKKVAQEAAMLQFLGKNPELAKRVDMFKNREKQFPKGFLIGPTGTSKED